MRAAEGREEAKQATKGRRKIAAEYIQENTAKVWKDPKDCAAEVQKDPNIAAEVQKDDSAEEVREDSNIRNHVACLAPFPQKLYLFRASIKRSVVGRLHQYFM